MLFLHHFALLNRLHRHGRGNESFTLIFPTKISILPQRKNVIEAYFLLFKGNSTINFLTTELTVSIYKSFQFM